MLEIELNNSLLPKEFLPLVTIYYDNNKINFIVMKTLNITFLILVLLLLLSNNIFSQDDNKSQVYWIHEDPVYPSMVVDYEEAVKDLVFSCKKFNIQEANWLALSTDDLRYFFVTAIEKMGDLDKSRFANLKDKMDPDKFEKIFDTFDDSYDTHYDYIVHLDKELSYMPDGINIIKEGKPFRKLQYWYVTPQNFDKVIEIEKSFKALYERKNSKEHYTLYRSGFGAIGDYIMVAIAAKSPEDYERVYRENKELLGEEGDKLYAELINTIIKVEILEGYMRLDLSYFPEK